MSNPISYEAWILENSGHMNMLAFNNNLTKNRDFDFNAFCRMRYQMYYDSITNDNSIDEIPEGDVKLHG